MLKCEDLSQSQTCRDLEEVEFVAVGADRFSVENQGGHISDELGEKIWTEAFTTSPEGVESTGLGLFIVKEISLMERTKCGFENTDKGVRFWFEFIDRFSENDREE